MMRRKTGGRKKGSLNRRTRELLTQAEAGGEMPLDYMLRIMRSKSKAISDERRDEMAKAAAPFLHSRLATVEHKRPPMDLSKLSDEELEFLARISRRIEEQGKLPDDTTAGGSKCGARH